MFKWLLLWLLLSTSAWAQNPTCPTRPTSDSSNACASTAFVHSVAGGSTTPTGPAGGDLGGTYPNPTVTNGSNITNGSIANSGLVNSSTTVNTISCALGSTCTIPIVPNSISGINCNGSFDNTSVINAALGSSGHYILPAGTCNVSGTLAMAVSNVWLQGSGMGVTILNFTGAGTGDGFDIGSMQAPGTCIGGSPPPACYQVNQASITDMTVQASSRTGGFLFNLDGTSGSLIQNILYSGWDLIQTQYVNSPAFINILGHTRDTTDYAVNMVQVVTSGTTAGWYRTDAEYFNWVTVNEQGAGGGCYRIDGFVQTVTMYATHALNCSYAFAVSNISGTSTFYPGFIETHDFEADGNTAGGVIIAAGSDFNFVDCDVNISQSSGSGDFPLVILPDLGSSVTRGWKSTGCSWHDAPSSGVFISGKNISMVGDHVFDTNHLGSATVPAVQIQDTGGNSDNITITGSQLGVRFGDPYAPTYGVSITSSFAGGLSLTGNDYDGGTGTLGSIQNLSHVTIGLTGGIAYNHVPITSVNCAATTVCN